MDVGAIVYFGIVVVLFVIFVVSFILFIRRLLVNSSAKNYQASEIERKLDKIIELLEKDRQSQ